MAKKKTNAPRQSTAPLDFEAELWRTADALRGSAGMFAQSVEFIRV
ncbi:MAG: hypothetical protein AB1477_10620 [Acidobacteriota bacterium]|jgi:hypothetical protein